MRSWWIALIAIGVGVIGFGATAQLVHAQEVAKSSSGKGRKVAKQSAEKVGEGAEEPAQRPISVSLLGGYGHIFNADDDLNPLGVGFGVRGGYNFDALYVGLRFLFFLGDSKSMPMAEVSASTLTVGLEGGYDLALATDVLVLRPELGVGLGIVEGESMAGGAAPTADGSSEDLYIAPGITLFANVRERSLIGVDVQVPIVFADDIEVALTVLAVAGMHF